MMQYGYWTALCALVLVTMYKGSLPMVRTLAAMLWVGVLSLALASRRGFGIDWTGEDYALTMMAADGLAAAVVLIRPAGKAQSVIGLTFLLQMAVYVARLLHGAAFDADAYWWLLSLLALLQLFVAGGWLIHERYHWGPAVPGRGRVPGAAHRPGVGG